jgi:NodT family efflux transporter outer membrane factor (OMF) lipoprotein
VSSSGQGSSRALLVATFLAGVGCAVGPDFVRPEASPDAGYSVAPTPTTSVVADGMSQRLVLQQKLAADWWRVFSCPSLDAVVAEAIAHNPTVEAAQASLRRSEDNLRAGYGVFYPQLDAQAGLSRQQYNPRKLGESVPSTTFNLYTVSGSVNYTLDIWGGERRSVEALAATAEAQRYSLVGTYLILSSNVVNAALAQAGYRDQVLATEKLLELEKEQLSITQAQAEAGIVPEATMLALETTVASAEATLPPLRQRIDETDDLLAALVGRTPGEWKQSSFALRDFTLPAELPLSLPSELVRQRPDVLTAEAQLHSANAQIGVTTAAMLPNITLSGTFGLASTSGTQLFSPASVLWGLGAGLTQPLFHGGTLWYQNQAAIDARDQAAANYRQTVLAAFQQVADTLRSLEHDAQALEAQSRAVKAAREALQLININYQTGTANYLQVLVADTQFEQAELGYIQAKTQRLQDTVALYVALGGGWWNAPASVVALPAK